MGACASETAALGQGSLLRGDLCLGHRLLAQIAVAAHGRMWRCSIIIISLLRHDIL
jgi:hypothetical protein